jgi:inorganic pyrophosphatase/exopolyphosphatase
MYDNCESKQKSISIIQSDMKVIHLGGKRIKMLQVNRKASWALLDFNLDLNHSTTTQREKKLLPPFSFCFCR